MVANPPPPSDDDDYFNSREFSRGTVRIDADLREYGGGKHKVQVIDLSRSGFRLYSLVYIRPDKQVFLTLPGMTPLEAKIAWKHGDYYGCAFEQPLHAAVYDHIVRKFPSLTDR